MRGRWSQKKADEKVLYVISSICSISILIVACLDIFGAWKIASDVIVSLLGVSMLIQAIQNWKKNKEIAKGSLCAAILALVYSIFIFVTR